MKYRTLGRSGLRVSEVSLGGAYLGGPDAERRRENASEVVGRALDLGVNYLDTAPYYGDSEELLGVALSDVERPVHLATKVGLAPQDFDYRSDSVLWSLERSLKRLGRDCLTVAQIHEVNHAGWERITEPGGTLAGLREAQKKGMCEFLGVTGRAIPLLAQLAGTGEFDTVLVYSDYHPASQLAAENLIPAAAAQNMGIVIASILGGGLFGHDDRREQLLKEMMDAAKRNRAEDILARLRAQPGSLAQTAFRWVLADDRVTTACSGAGTIAEIEDVAQASAMGPLTRDEMES